MGPPRDSVQFAGINGAISLVATRFWYRTYDFPGTHKTTKTRFCLASAICAKELDFRAAQLKQAALQAEMAAHQARVAAQHGAAQQRGAAVVSHRDAG